MYATDAKRISKTRKKSEVAIQSSSQTKVSLNVPTLNPSGLLSELHQKQTFSNKFKRFDLSGSSEDVLFSD